MTAKGWVPTFLIRGISYLKNQGFLWLVFFDFDLECQNLNQKLKRILHVLCV